MIYHRKSKKNIKRPMSKQFVGIKSHFDNFDTNNIKF